MRARVSWFAPRDIFAKLNPHVRRTLRYNTTILYHTRDQITTDLKGAKWVDCAKLLDGVAPAAEKLIKCKIS